MNNPIQVDAIETWWSGSRDSSTHWRFIPSDFSPPDELITCAFGVVYRQGKIICTKNHRGREIPGGHRETGESVKDCLYRELHEEAGVRPESIVSAKLFAHTKITLDTPKRKRWQGCYPFPYSYMLHYVCRINHKPEKPYGEEIIDAQPYSIEQIYAHPDIDMVTKNMVKYSASIIH